ncbi:hypothetical protein BJ322DRAFT_1110064 [Thelephora terrestris]|uniref:Uncharacterized protein n=1 Tax=Thelephora terrestris TaxID=56493 RepID=A0A9P6HDU1_9AGAM|nr:hypothetical protein BJ322DRAFT_1110064 [Thelephora terrestris]
MTPFLFSHEPRPFGARQPLRDDKIFVPFRIALREAKTLVTFVYKSRHCQGKLVPIPYPRNSDGEPVPPAKLIDHVESNGWDTNPNCFCSIRDQERVAALYVPRKISSPAYGQMSLVCPESECPYYVNIQEMYDNAETRQTLLSVEDDAIALPQSSGKKRKTRIPSWEARASGVIPVVNQFDLISKLFSRMGISRGEFDALFVICPKCNRMMTWSLYS